MVFVPDAVPHFVLVCREQTGWSVRDYSSGQPRLLPAAVLGRPIEDVVDGPRPDGFFAFRAPRVPASEHNFWKRLTQELGQRFLGALAPGADLPRGYPVLAEPDFDAAASPFDPLTIECIRQSPRSAEWITWNAIQLLRAAQPRAWWQRFSDEAARANPANQFQKDTPPQIGFWRSALHPDDRNAGSPTRVDLQFDGGNWLVFADAAVRDGPDRVVRLADCLLTAAQGRDCALWILARKRSISSEYVELVERYHASPEMFAAELPHHPADTLYRLAQRLVVLRWPDLLGDLVLRRDSDDPLTARVRKELKRRVQGAARAAGA